MLRCEMGTKSDNLDNVNIPFENLGTRLSTCRKKGVAIQ